MKYICGQNSLQFKQHGKDTLYYKYQAKLTRNKLLDQRNRLQVMLDEIIKEEQAEKGKISKQRHHFTQEGFYQYTTSWKNRVNQEINKKVIANNQETAKKEEQHMKLFSSNHHNNPKKNNKHKGPISDWKGHFDNFIRNKSSINYNQLSFRPTINEKSNIMLSKSEESVETRLIKYGRKIQMKKQEIANQYYNQFTKNHEDRQENSSTYEKLYKEGERIHRDRISNEQPYPFKPQINKLSEIMEERVKLTRQPLYPSKRQTNDNQESNVKHTKKSTHTSDSFNDFIRRNETLIEMKKKLQTIKETTETQKQKIKESQCTFNPQINPKSRQILTNRQESQNSYIQGRMQEVIMNQTRAEETDRIRVESSDQEPSYVDSFDQSMQSKDAPLSTSPRSLSNPCLYQFKNDFRRDKNPFDQGNVIDELIEEDSIEKIKTAQWQIKLQQVEDQLEQMIKKARKN